MHVTGSVRYPHLSGFRQTFSFAESSIIWSVSSDSEMEQGLTVKKIFPGSLLGPPRFTGPPAWQGLQGH